MNENRKAFQNLPADENPHFTKDGLEIYENLRKKYPENTTVHLDNILNGIAASFVILARNHVVKDDVKYFIQLFFKIINGNL